MRPILLEIGVFYLASWYVFFALAGICAYSMAQYLVSKSKYSMFSRHINIIFIICYCGGWLGARLTSMIHEGYSNPFWVELFSFGSMTFYGGFILAIILTTAYIFCQKIPFLPLLDLLFIVGIFALGIGRIGCFLNGCDFGAPISSYLQTSQPWWSHQNLVLQDGIFRYPTQLEEAFFSIILSLTLAVIFKKKLTSNPSQFFLRKFPWGFCTALILFFSALNRYLNEYFRADERGYFLNTFLTFSQGFALIFMLLGIVLAFIVYINKGHVPNSIHI